MSHPNLTGLTGRDPECSFPIYTVATTCLAHEHCVVLTHYEQRIPDGPWAIAWDSHAHDSTHVACRIGDATPTCEDRTVPGGQLVEWAPQCVDCHVILACPERHHHASGMRRREDGVILLHRDHPRFGYIKTHNEVEVHSGSSYADCERCAGHALACDGCREVFETEGESLQ